MLIRHENRQAKQLTFTIRKIVIDMWISYSLVTTITFVLSSVGKGYERRLSNEITKAVRMRDEYMKELQMIPWFDAVGESVEIMRHMQVDDMEAASRLMLMATKMQMKVGFRVGSEIAIPSLRHIFCPITGSPHIPKAIKNFGNRNAVSVRSVRDVNSSNRLNPWLNCRRKHVTTASGRRETR
ncbi:hypothetical protein Tco_0121900 [Tanacetum coccineum]